MNNRSRLERLERQAAPAAAGSDDRLGHSLSDRINAWARVFVVLDGLPEGWSDADALAALEAAGCDAELAREAPAAWRRMAPYRDACRRAAERECPT